MLTAKHLETLENRGLDAETVSRLGWSSVEGKRDGRDWIEIPYFRRGVLVGKKFRTIDEGEKQFYQEKGSEQCLYNLDCIIEINEATPIVITEGEMDCVIAIQHGHHALSVPNGAPHRPVQQEDTTKFDYLADIPEKNPLILAVDSDEPGKILLNEIAKRLGRHRCQWVKYPKGCKDLNDTFLRYGARGVEEVFKRAEWVRVEGLYRMSELPPAPAYEAFDCKVEGLSDYYRIRQGDVSVVSGMPSHGKTTLVNEIVCNMAFFHGWNVCVGSFEQSPKPDHQRYLRTYHLKKPAHLVPEDTEAMMEADAWINQHFFFVIPDIDSEEFSTIDWVLERCAEAVKRHGCKLVVIDPWNEMDHHRPNGMSLTEYTGWAIKQIKRFARKYQVHVIVVAHPAKMEKTKDGSYPIPTLYDISDSSHWYNKPDLGLIVYRTDEMLTLVRVQKCRYVGVIGQPGQVMMRYDSYLGIFLALTEEETKEHIDEWKAKKSKATDGSGEPSKWWKKRKKKSEVEDHGSLV